MSAIRLFPTPEELGELHSQDILRGWKSLMKRHSGDRKAQAILSIACRSDGSKQATHAYKLYLK